jgi:hypothetical protein
MILDKGFILQFLASALAVALLVGLAAWARIARPMTPLVEARARVLLEEEFPGEVLDQVWVAVDGRGALVRSGVRALILCEVGDAYVARDLDWSEALAAPFRDGVVHLTLKDIAAPRARLALASWPPVGEAT